MHHYWRGWYSYILLFAVVFKSLILGMLFTLAIHNVCFETLASENFNWSGFASGKRKRNDENAFISSLNVGEVAPGEITVSKKTPFLLRLLQAVFQSFIEKVQILRIPPYPDTGYIPERIFLHHCILRR